MKHKIISSLIIDIDKNIGINQDIQKIWIVDH